MEKIEHTTVATNGISMHVATIGTGPPVLFVHGFRELWYSWRHQLLYLSSQGYRCIAPDLRGYGDTDAPPSISSYTALHIVGDLIGLLDNLGTEQVFLVGHDWGAFIAWQFCLFRPDKIKAPVNLSVAFNPRNPNFKTSGWPQGHVWYQGPREIEEEFAQIDTAKLMKRFLSSHSSKPPPMPREIGIRGLPDTSTLPPRLSEEDVNYYATKFNQKGFTRGLNYYRCINLNWELTAAWTGLQVKVPVKFIVGDLDLPYHLPGMKEYIHNGGFRGDVPFLQEVVVMEGVAHFLNHKKVLMASCHFSLLHPLKV